MVKEPSEEEILKHLLDAAYDRWGVDMVKTILTSFENAASDISRVEEAHLKPEEEPAFKIALSRRIKYARAVEKEE